MVGVVEHDRLGREAGLFKLLQPGTGISIDFTDLVVILCPVLANFRSVGVIGRHADRSPDR